MEAYTAEQMNQMSLNDLADLGYRLTKTVKAAEETLKLVKARFKKEAQSTGVMEYMGNASKVVISERASTEVNAREFFKRLKANKQESIFWATCKVGLTEARKLAPDLVEELAVTTVDPYNTISFK